MRCVQIWRGGGFKVPPPKPAPNERKVHGAGLSAHLIVWLLPNLFLFGVLNFLDVSYLLLAIKCEYFCFKKQNTAQKLAQERNFGESGKNRKRLRTQNRELRSISKKLLRRFFPCEFVHSMEHHLNSRGSVLRLESDTTRRISYAAYLSSPARLEC